MRTDGLLRLLGRLQNFVERLLVLLRVAAQVLILVLEVRADLLRNRKVKEAPPQRPVRARRQDAELAVPERDHRGREVRSAHVEKEDLGFLVLRELLAGRAEDAVLQGDRRRLVDQLQAVDVRDLAGIEKSTPLRVRVVGRDADGRVPRDDAALGVGRHRVKMPQQAGNDLLRPQNLLSVSVGDLDADEAIFQGHELRSAEGGLHRNIVLVKLAADDVAHVVHRAQVVGSDDRFRVQANVALAIGEADHGGILPRARLVQAHVDSSARRRGDEAPGAPQVDSGNGHDSFS
mmetsp:Transcript_13391/g.49734  ORF Transcript_13391/g.49734 Transcript_13391/m.49734 type:complete len:290 (-) Transcript_13391:152-1021(-)